MPKKTKQNPIGIAGITTDPWRRKGQWRHDYPKMKNWLEAGPFCGREEGIVWEKEQEALGYQTSNGGDDTINDYADWYGYRFDLPQPKTKRA